MRKLIDKKLNTLEDERSRLKELDLELQEVEGQVAVLEKSKAIMQQAAKMSQEHLASHLSSIVTQAIQAVIGKPYHFICEFVERRGATEADLYLMKDGDRFELLSGTGGGLADVCSFSLKIAYLLLSNVDKVLIIDEVSRHINSPDQRVRFAEVLKRLSEEFQIQLIINTTIPEILDVADNVIELVEVNGETFINEKAQ